MSKEFYIRLTLGVYKVSGLFPEQELLKTDLRELADEILVSLMTGQYENSSRTIEEMNNLLNLAESRGLADPRNFSVLRREYNRVSELIEGTGVNDGKTVENSSDIGKNKKRQEVILGILKAEGGKVKMSDLAKSFPNINRRTILRDLGVFCQSGAVERAGSGRGACYTIKNATL